MRWGFYTGYAKAEPVEKKPIGKDEVPGYLGKLPPETSFVLAKKYAAKLKITPAEVAKIDTEMQKILPEYFAAQKKSWEVDDMAKVSARNRKPTFGFDLGLPCPGCGRGPGAGGVGFV